MVEYDRNQQRENSGREPLRICVAGVGGAGSNVLDRITMDRTIEATLVSFQTDVRVLHHSTSPRKIQLGTDLMRGVGAGGDPDLGREAALFSKEEIRNAVEGHDMVFISVGLGGGTGSGAAPVVAEIAKSSGALVLVFAAVPFGFEGRRRQQQAQDALDRLQKCADALILFDNSRMGELVLPKDGIQKAFSQADQLIAQSVRAVTGMIGAPGIVKLGLDDLVSALRTNEGRCLFGFGEAKGQNRGTEALKKALKSPLINQGQLLQSAKNLLVHIVGGESLTLAEVEVVMKQLGRHVPDETQILFGIGVEPKLGESVTVTLVSSLSATEMATRTVVVEPERREAPVRAIAPAAPAPAPAPAPVSAPVPAPAAVPVSAPAPAAAPVVQAEAPALHLFAEEEAMEPLRPSAAMQAAIASVVPPPVELFKPAAPAPELEARPAPVVRREPAQAPELEARPAPVVRREPAPAPAPAPVPEPEPEAFESEVVYQTADPEPEEDEEPVMLHPEPAAPARAQNFKLASVIETAPPVAQAPAPRPVAQPLVIDEVNLEPTEEHTPVVQAMAETVTIQLPRTNTRAAAAAPEPVVSHTETAVQEEEFAGADLFGSSPAPVATMAAKKAAPAAEQQTFRLGSNEDRGRFKDTEPAVVQGEDLDTPTWMRLRRRVAR